MNFRAVEEIGNKHYLKTLTDSIGVVCMKNCDVLKTTSDLFSQNEKDCLVNCGKSYRKLIIRDNQKHQ